MSIDSISNRLRVDTAILKQEDTASHQANYEKASTAKKVVLGILTLGIAAIYFAVKESKQEALAQATVKSTINLRHVLEAFTPNQDATISLVMNGIPVHLHQKENNVLVATIDNKDIKLPHTAAQLKEKLEDDMVQNVNFYGKDKVFSMLQNLNDNDSTRPRLRNLFSQALTGVLGIQEKDLGAITTPLLKLFTEMALKGHFTSQQEFENLFLPLCNNNLINTAESLDLINKFESEQKTDPISVASKVSIDSSRAQNLIVSHQEMQNLKVRNLAADLIFNERTWDIDKNIDIKGKRLHLTLNEHLDTIIAILKDRSCLDFLEPEIKDPLNEILNTLENIKPVNEAKQEFNSILSQEDREIYNELNDMFDLQNITVKDLLNSLNQKQLKVLTEITLNLMPLENFAAAEQSIDENVKEMAAALQQNISEQFARMCDTSTSESADTDYDNKSLDDLLKESGTDLNSDGYGKFMKEVINTYFANISLIDQRSVIAAGIRYGKENADLGTQLGALLKGAGPIMQKMLQGFNTEGMDATFRTALQDMKSNLAPINNTIIQSYLLDMVEKSHGKIHKIEMTKSLGAASVGQALLCKMYTDEHPEGTDCVIKILRPDAKLRADREKAIFQEAALKVPGMERTFAGQLERIMAELDLTQEASNIKDGAVYDNYFPTKVQSMKLSSLVDPTTNTMVLEKAPGITLDNYLQGIDAKIEEAAKPYEENIRGQKEAINATEESVRTVTSNVLTSLNNLYIEVEKRQQLLIDLTAAWVTQGIYGGGFYHGDLHAGNIMIDDDLLTVIDFGNATKLTADDQTQITLMAAAAIKSDASKFLEGYQKLLSSDGKKAFNQHRDEISSVVDKILTKGTEEDTGKRIAVALSAIQKFGVEAPAPIFNFSQCQLRLQAAVDAMNGALDKIKNKMKEVAPSGTYSFPPYLNILVTLNITPNLFKEGVPNTLKALYALKSALLQYHATGECSDNTSLMITDHCFNTLRQNPEDKISIQTLCEQANPEFTEIRRQIIALKNDSSEDAQKQKATLYNEYFNRTMQYYEAECDRYIDLVTSLNHKEPYSFCDCMADVIQQNFKSSLNRLGFFTALKYSRT